MNDKLILITKNMIISFICGISAFISTKFLGDNVQSILISSVVGIIVSELIILKIFSNNSINHYFVIFASLFVFFIYYYINEFPGGKSLSFFACMIFSLLSCGMAAMVTFSFYLTKGIMRQLPTHGFAVMLFGLIGAIMVLRNEIIYSKTNVEFIDAVAIILTFFGVINSVGILVLSSVIGFVLFIFNRKIPAIIPLVLDLIGEISP